MHAMRTALLAALTLLFALPIAHAGTREEMARLRDGDCTELPAVRARAQAGDSAYQMVMGLATGLGLCMAPDWSASLQWHQKAANQGNMESALAVGSLYRDGWGTPKDLPRAAEYFRRSAEGGNSEAQYELAILYTFGRGVAQDLTEGARWHSKSARQGNARAQAFLGMFYQAGQGGLAPDDRQAVYWLEKSAVQGNSVGQYHLAEALIMGRGTDRDPLRAYAWLTLASLADKKHADAPIKRDELGARLTPEQRSEGQRLARSWTIGRTLGEPAVNTSGTALR
jgi:uncharacterized protein